MLAAALSLAACATDAPTADRDCFRSGQVHGFELVDDNHVRLTVGAGRAYVLKTMWNARDLDWATRIALRSSTGLICTGSGVGVEVIGGRPRRAYPIESIERAPDESPAAQAS
jgi:hypothetical protein